ncbi:6-phospho-beta-glucosidase [Spiroplasma sabaudiense Ar-1343]|uniref:6-phospho-beta-glucosidase n=1 Tax=Spiroplasma sabaudiense Ar-1343 TaxID=1276257 RepID=W6AAE2_9MOLU|nr:glycoside hydrolase family 1 protein [Spiroplasma sabaudiense]AHI53810.1 6-phospho-beta-glucosidase [Spiroplasma sabaudiense Ar-1343]
MQEINFTKDFLFGASFSGPQTEGNYSKVNQSNWDKWFMKSPEKFFNEYGPEKLHDLKNNFKNDVALMKATNLSSVRTSIQWSRLIRDFDKNEIDPEGLKFYLDYFKEIKNQGIELHLCLHHFDMPAALEAIGGWKSQVVIDKFVEFAKICFSHFKNFVDKWITFNEPLVIVDSGYVYGYHLPLINDFQISMNVALNLMYANALVIESFRKLNIDSEIGICLNLTPAYPMDKTNPLDVKACEFEHTITNNIFLYPAIKGIIDPKLIKMLNDFQISFEASQSMLLTIKNNTVDFLGVNYYAPVRLTGKSMIGKATSRDFYFKQEIHPDSNINQHRGWEIYGKGLYEIAQWIKEDFNNIRWMVQENGIGVGEEERFMNSGLEVQDDYRINFYKEHLYWLNQAINQGANCFGYHVWTFIDNWSWLNAFKNRYGLYTFDLKTNKRTMKSSGKWFKQLSQEKKLSYSKDEIDSYKKHILKF